MLFKIIDIVRGKHLAFDTDVVDVIRIQDGELDGNVIVLAMFKADQASPILEYDISKLFLEERLQLFNEISKALNDTSATVVEYVLPR